MNVMPFTVGWVIVDAKWIVIGYVLMGVTVRMVVIVLMRFFAIDVASILAIAIPVPVAVVVVVAVDANAHYYCCCCCRVAYIFCCL